MEKKKRTKTGGKDFTAESARKAQKKSTETRLKHKQWREYIEVFGRMPIDVPLPDKDKKGNQKKMHTDWNGAVVAAAYRAAMLGDDKARAFIGKMSGQWDDTIHADVNIKQDHPMTAKEAAEFMAELEKQI